MTNLIPALSFPAKVVEEEGGGVVGAAAVEAAEVGEALALGPGQVGAQSNPVQYLLAHQEVRLADAQVLQRMDLEGGKSRQSQVASFSLGEHRAAELEIR